MYFVFDEIQTWNSFGWFLFITQYRWHLHKVIRPQFLKCKNVRTLAWPLSRVLEIVLFDNFL